MNNVYLNDLFFYMEGEWIFSYVISYKYIIENRDINLISKNIFLSNEKVKLEKLFGNRNFENEFKLIKLTEILTEISNYKLQQIDIEK